MKEKTYKVVRETIETIVVALILALFIRAFFLQVFWIPSGSMEPTLEIKDRLIVNKLSYGLQNPIHEFVNNPKVMFFFANPLYKTSFPLSGNKYFWEFNQPKREQIIVFHYPVTRPGDDRKDLIKRIIGLPGETLQVRDGVVYINDVPLVEKHSMNQDLANFGPVRVPKDSYFMMGDNRPNSADSRFWGFLPKECVVGRAMLRIWPLTRLGII